MSVRAIDLQCIVLGGKAELGLAGAGIAAPPPVSSTVVEPAIDLGGGDDPDHAVRPGEPRFIPRYCTRTTAGDGGDTTLRSLDGSTIVGAVFDVAGSSPGPRELRRAFEGRWWVADDNKVYRYVGDRQFMAADGSRYIVGDDGCFHRAKKAPSARTPEGDTVLRTLDGTSVVATIFDVVETGRSDAIDRAFQNTAFLADDGQVYRYAGSMTFIAASGAQIRIGDDGCFHYGDD